MRFIIDFVNTTSEADIASYFDVQKCTIINKFDAIGQTYLVSSDSVPEPTEITEYVTRDDEHGVSLLSEPATITFDSAPVDMHTTTNEDNWWKLAIVPRVDLDSAQFSTIRTADGVRVYIIDSGIHADHPEFIGKDVSLLHSINGDFSDTTGHGTALASVVVGDQCGITNASLKVVKIFHKGQATYMSDILSALNAVATDYITNALAPAVVNCSWSVATNEMLNKKFADLRNLGLLVVAAAGNSGIAIADVSPAAIKEVTTIGSFGPTLVPSDFSNYTGSDTSLTTGSTNFGGIDLFAPGENIKVATIGGQYGYTAGTSIAAAITSACFAINIARLTHSYQYFKQNDLEGNMIFWATKDMLVLSGNYASSPNLVISARITPSGTDATPRVIVNAPKISAVGTPVAIRVADPVSYQTVTLTGMPDGYSLDGGYLIGTASDTVPESGFVMYNIDVTLTKFDGSTTDSYVLTYLVYDPAIFTTLEDVVGAAAITIKFDCSITCDCCLDFGKMFCDSCTCFPSGGLNYAC